MRCYLEELRCMHGKWSISSHFEFPGSVDIIGKPLQPVHIHTCEFKLHEYRSTVSVKNPLNMYIDKQTKITAIVYLQCGRESAIIYSSHTLVSIKLMLLCHVHMCCVQSPIITLFLI